MHLGAYTLCDFEFDYCTSDHVPQLFDVPPPPLGLLLELFVRLSAPPLAQSLLGLPRLAAADGIVLPGRDSVAVIVARGGGADAVAAGAAADRTGLGDVVLQIAGVHHLAFCDSPVGQFGTLADWPLGCFDFDGES